MSPTQPNLAIPYPGLRPFDEADHLLFFGRNEQANELLMRLEDSAFVAVVGSSGSGKSSLVRAGVLPLLRDGFLFGTENWKIAVARPEHEPYERLARKLTAFRDDVPKEKVLTLLRGSDDGLLQAVDTMCDDSEAHVLVVIDQFEELFGFRRAGDAQRQSQNYASRDEAAAFVAMLLAAARKDGDRLRVMLTMRSDFVGDCEVFLGLPQAVSQSQFLVPRLTRSQMEAAITGPSRIRHAGFEPFDFEPGLITTLTNDAGDRPDQLPLLQHALMRTWKLSDRKLLTASDYTTAGRIDKALSNDADEAWEQLDDNDQQLARQMFVLLCDVSREGQMTRRRPLVQEVMAVAQVGRADIERVVRVFQDKDRNFLLPPSSEPISPTSVLDISHESLLRQWGQVQSWLAREADAARQYRRLVDAVQAGEKQLGGEALNRALDWRRTRRTPTWAMRYDNAHAPEESLFPKCLEFIEDSKQLRDSEEAEAEFGRKLRIARNVIAAFLLSSIILFLMNDPLREQLGIQSVDFELPENIIVAFYREDIVVLPIRHFTSLKTIKGTSEADKHYKSNVISSILKYKHIDKSGPPGDHVKVALHNKVKVSTIEKLKESDSYKNVIRPKNVIDDLEQKSANQVIYVLPINVLVASKEEDQPGVIQVAFSLFGPETILDAPELVEKMGRIFLLVVHLLLYATLIFVFKTFYRRFAFRDNEVLGSFQVGSRRSQVVFSVVLLIVGLVLLGAGLVLFVLEVREKLPMLLLGVPIGVILILLVPTDTLLKRSWALRFKEAQGIVLQLCGFYALAGSVYLLMSSSPDEYSWAPELLLVRNPWALLIAAVGLVILGKRKYVQATPQALVREADRAPVLVNSQTKLYSDRAIGLAAFSMFGFGLPAGVMMFSNLWCIGRRWAAGIGLVAPIVGIVGTVGFAILILDYFDELELEMGALVVMVLSGSSFATYWLWRRLSGREIRDHVSFGGALQPRGKALLVLLIASFLAWSLPLVSIYQDTRLRADRRSDPTQPRYQAHEFVYRGLELARQGDVEGAITAFKTAQGLEPTIDLDPRTNTIEKSPEAVAQLLNGQHLARQGDVEGAITAFKAAQKFDPDIDLDPETKTKEKDSQAVAQQLTARAKAQERVSEGRRLVRKGENDKVPQAFAEARKLDPSLETSATYWNTVSWNLSLSGHFQEGLDAGEKSVMLTGKDDPSLASRRDTRGLARALTGDYQGAIEDFEAYIRSDGAPLNQKSQREQWVATLRKGQNHPFTPEVLKTLWNQ